jgi:hypothetical protein
VVLLASCGSGGTGIRDAYGRPDSTRVELSIDACRAVSTTVDVEETADVVRFAVTTEGGDDGPECLDSVVVELDEPLGDRRVVDASTGDEVELSPAES